MISEKRKIEPDKYSIIVSQALGKWSLFKNKILTILLSFSSQDVSKFHDNINFSFWAGQNWLGNLKLKREIYSTSIHGQDK